MKNTIEVAARYDLLLTRVGMTVHEDNVFVDLNKEQYDRIKVSYDTGKFKQMNEDPDIADLYELFNKAGNPAENQKLLVDYPYTVANGMTFEEVKKVQETPLTDEEIDALAEAAAETDAEWLDKILEAHAERLDGTPEEEDAKYDALAELQNWMTKLGFSAGETDCALEDDEGWAIETVDIGWPYGIASDKGYFKPLAVQFYHTTPELLELAKKNGFEVFESIEEFKAFIEKNCRR
jgi:hypothetical protein